jgi:Fic family protein
VLQRFIPALAELDDDLRKAFLERLRVRWTHTSTALEGNTLSEGDTLGVLRYGLTIAGKPLAHHNEVLGHSRALGLLFEWLADGRALTVSDLHQLHTAVQTSVEVDYLKPVGDWKREPNSSLARQGLKTVINDTYARPEEVPSLMRAWLEGFEQRRRDPGVSALDAYVWSHAAFVRIHPYADGNGRLARLLANLPVIEKGTLPLLVPATSRLEYVDCLAAWQLASGAVKMSSTLMGDEDSLRPFQQLMVVCERESALMLAEFLAAHSARRINP